MEEPASDAVQRAEWELSWRDASGALKQSSKAVRLAHEVGIPEAACREVLVRARTVRSHAHRLLGQPEAAIESAAQAAALARKLPFPHELQGQALFAEFRSKEALGKLDEAHAGYLALRKRFPLLFPRSSLRGAPHCVRGETGAVGRDQRRDAARR